MKAYVICILFTVLFAFLSQKSLKHQKKILGIIFLIISLLVPCLIAGVRSENIGTDVNVYLKGLFNRTQQSNFTILSEYKNSGIDLGFICLVYSSTLIFKSLNFTFFVVELAVSLPIFIYAYLQRNNKSIVFTILIFLLTMYCISLSMMRQSIAISLVLLSTYFMEKKDFKKTIVLYIMAILFHQSAIITIAIYLSYYIIKKYKNNRSIYLFLLLIGITAFCLLIPVLLPYLPFRFESYLEKGNVSAVNFLSVLKILIWMVPTIICINLCKKERNDYYDLLIFSIFLIFLNITFYLAGMKLPIVSRASLYFSNVLYFILLPLFQVKIKPRLVINLFLIFLIALFWWHMTAVDGSSFGTYPYRSNIISFLN